MQPLDAIDSLPIIVVNLVIEINVFTLLSLASTYSVTRVLLIMCGFGQRLITCSIIKMPLRNLGVDRANH